MCILCACAHISDPNHAEEAPHVRAVRHQRPAPSPDARGPVGSVDDQRRQLGERPVGKVPLPGPNSGLDELGQRLLNQGRDKWADLSGSVDRRGVPAQPVVEHGRRQCGYLKDVAIVGFDGLACESGER